MNWIDLVLVLFLLLGIFHGYKAGFLLELFALIAVVLGVIGGFKLMGWAMVLLAGRFEIDKKILPYIAFAAVFLIIVLIVNLLGKLLKASVDRTFLGSIDQLAGGFLALVRTAFMLSIVIWIIDSLDIKYFSRQSDDSWLYHALARFAPKLTDWLGEILPVFKDVF